MKDHMTHLRPKIRTLEKLPVARSTGPEPGFCRRQLEDNIPQEKQKGAELLKQDWRLWLPEAPNYLMSGVCEQDTQCEHRWKVGRLPVASEGWSPSEVPDTKRCLRSPWRARVQKSTKEWGKPSLSIKAFNIGRRMMLNALTMSRTTPIQHAVNHCLLVHYYS